MPEDNESQIRRQNFDNLELIRENQVEGSSLVPGAGIEPARNQVSRDFKSLASTNSATQA
jgi:hypothetical protein